MRRNGFASTTPSRVGSADVGRQPSHDEGEATMPLEHLDVLAAVGYALADPIAAMNLVVQEYKRHRAVTPEHMDLLVDAVESAQKVATQSQQIARLASGKLRQSHERLRLDELLGAALQEHAKDFHSRGVELQHTIRPVEVIVDPGLLVSLLDAALEWAVMVGQKLTVSLDMKNWPEHGLLFIKASQSVVLRNIPHGEADEPDPLVWILLANLAHAMGISAERVQSERESILMLEFPRTVKRLEGMSSVELDTGFDSLGSEPRALAGNRVLVITANESMRWEIQAVVESMGLEMSAVSNSAQAERFCELDPPNAIIIDERSRDQVFDALRSDLIRINPNFPFVEIAQQSNILEMAGWGSESMARLSADGLRAQLPSLLALELARTM